MHDNKNQLIDPWGSDEIKIDQRLFEKFGLSPFLDFTNYDFHLFERNIIIAHRDFSKIDQCIKAKRPFIQMTGIASSGPFHLGHKVDIDLFKYFKKVGAKSFFGVCDIDAYVSRPNTKVPNLSKAKEYAVDNIAHLLASGINENDIYLQSQKESRYYTFALELSKKITENEFKATYGHTNFGKLSANLLQYADILHQQLAEYNGPTPTIVGIGLEQDPHARITRDLVKRIEYQMVPPSFIYFKHQGGLQEGKKMSASEPLTAIFLSDTKKEIERKINKSFSGGQPNIEEHRRLGGNPSIDKSFEILNYHHPNTKFINKIKEEYSSGKMLSGELKKITIEFLNEFLEKHQQTVEENRKIAKEIVYKNSKW